MQRVFKLDGFRFSGKKLHNYEKQSLTNGLTTGELAFETYETTIHRGTPANSVKLEILHC